MVGEQLHEIGREGAIRAKRWLDATTRVKASWLNTDPAGAAKLSFVWPASPQTFSFDIGGVLRGGEFENEMFMGECKKYTTSNQGTAYREYLAKCYVVLLQNPALADHFMWITWHPFLVESWTALCRAPYVSKSVVQERARVFGHRSTAAAAQEGVDEKICEEVARRLWLLVLSDRQEQLVITDTHRGVVMKYEIENAGAW